VNRPFARAYFRAAARMVSAPWSIAVGGDFAYDGTSGKKPFATDVLNHYMNRVIKAGQCDERVVIRLNEVVSLVRNPQSLMSPAFALRRAPSSASGGPPRSSGLRRKRVFDHQHAVHDCPRARRLMSPTSRGLNRIGEPGPRRSGTTTAEQSSTATGLSRTAVAGRSVNCS